jgi:tetratricopeptide (TPR) repeat protein
MTTSTAPQNMREAWLTMWDFSDPAASETRLRAALNAATPLSDWALVLNTQIARSLGLRARFEEQHALLDQQETRAMASSSRLVRMVQMVERGRAFNASKQQAKALPLFERAFAMGIEPGASAEPGVEALAADAIHMVAIAQGGESGIATNRRGLALARASTDPGARRWEGPFLNNIGYELKLLKRYDEALATFQAAIEPYERRGVAWQARVVHWHIAHIHRLQGRNAQALGIQERLEREGDADGKPDAYVYEELMLLQMAQGQKAAAQSYAIKAKALLQSDSWFQQNEAQRWAAIERAAGAP